MASATANPIAEMASPLMALPLDIIESILCHIDLPHDLLSVALTSRRWAALIIPRYIEYRQLWLREVDDKVWTHLAVRADLAANIREVRLMGEPHKPRQWPDRSPKSFLHTSEGLTSLVNSATDAVTQNPFIQALTNMKFLQSFTWIDPPKQDRDDVFTLLKSFGTLLDLKLEITAFSPEDDIVIKRCIDSNYPLLHISGLRSLGLLGNAWRHWGRDSDLTSMLSRSPDLEVLVISYTITSPSFASCRFSRLRKLSLWGSYGGGQEADDTIMHFLEAHPTIEDLRWYPADQGLQLIPGCLPRLKRIESSHGFAMRILRDRTIPRALESVSQISLGQNTLRDIEHINRASLRELHIWRYDNMKAIERLAELFPNLTVLEIPKFGIATGADADMGYTLDDYILQLHHFPLLESLLDSAIWTLIGMKEGYQKQLAVSKLARWCPNLKHIGHFDSRSNHAVDIVLLRGEDKVTWKEEPYISMAM